MKYYSNLENNEILHLRQHVWAWSVCYPKGNKSDRKRYIMYDFILHVQVKKQNK